MVAAHGRRKAPRWNGRRPSMAAAAVAFCALLESILGAAAYMAWGLRDWDGIAVLAVSAVIAAGFPLGARWATEPAARTQGRGEQADPDTRRV